MGILGRFRNRKDRELMKMKPHRSMKSWSKPYQHIVRSNEKSPIEIHLQSKSMAMEPVEIGADTMQAMQVEIHDLFMSNKPVTVAAMASALAGCRKIFDHPCPYGKTEGHSILLRVTNSLRDMRFGKHRRSQNLEALKFRYDLINALNRLEKSFTSTITTVSSWDEAKEALSSVIKFPVDQLQDEESANDDISSKYTKRLDECFQVSERDTLVSLTDKWKKVASYPIPARLDKNRASDLEIAHRTALDDADNSFSLRLAAAVDDLAIVSKSKDVKEVEDRLLQQEREEEARKRASALMRPLTEKERESVQRAMFGIGPAEEPIARAGSDYVQRSSMQTLQPGTWLNDEVIHHFLLMLSKRDEEMCQKDPSRKRSHFFKSFFITKLLNEGNSNPDVEGTYDYKNVKRWSKKVPGKDLFQLDKIFFPINEGRMHWLCAVAFISEKRIEIFDSMGSDGTHYLEYIFRYLQDEHRDKKGSPLPNIDEWELVPCRHHTPRQRNGYDCGVFTCMFCDFVAKDCPLVFSQEHITQCRERIALSILNGKAIM